MTIECLLGARILAVGEERTMNKKTKTQASWSSWSSGETKNEQRSVSMHNKMSNDNTNYKESPRTLFENMFSWWWWCPFPKIDFLCYEKEQLPSIYPASELSSLFTPTSKDLFTGRSPSCVGNRQQIIYFRVNLTFQITNSPKAPSTTGR